MKKLKEEEIGNFFPLLFLRIFQVFTNCLCFYCGIKTDEPLISVFYSEKSHFSE